MKTFSKTIQKSLLKSNDFWGSASKGVAKTLALLSLVCAGLGSCQESASVSEPDSVSIAQELDSVRQEQIQDSMLFRLHHHYTVGYNFFLTSDSLRLLPSPPVVGLNLEYAGDTAVLYEGDDFVVTEILYGVQDDSLSDNQIWIRIGSDGIPLGWVEEKTMLDNSSPTDPISQMINYFSGSHLYYLYGLMVLTLIVALCRRRGRLRIKVLQIHEIRSFYPTAFCISLATAAMLYATIQLFVPQTWVEFYFHPSLNPLCEPWLIMWFLLLVWLSLILLLASVFDLFERMNPLTAISVLLWTLTWGGILYVVLTLSIQLYVGYLLWAGYVVFALSRYFGTNANTTSV